MSVICLTCQILLEEVLPKGGVIYKDNLVILHHCLDINVAGYFILSPIRHVESLDQLGQDELFQLATISNVIVEVIAKEHDIDRVYLLSLGEETTHFHWHIFPRYKWMLNFPAEEIRTSGKVDGAKLFSFIRNKYKVDKQELFDDRSLEILNKVKKQLRQKDETNFL